MELEDMLVEHDRKEQLFDKDNELQFKEEEEPSTSIAEQRKSHPKDDEEMLEDFEDVRVDNPSKDVDMNCGAEARDGDNDVKNASDDSASESEDDDEEDDDGSDFQDTLPMDTDPGSKHEGSGQPAKAQQPSTSDDIAGSNGKRKSDSPHIKRGKRQKTGLKGIVQPADLIKSDPNQGKNVKYDHADTIKGAIEMLLKEAPKGTEFNKLEFREYLGFIYRRRQILLNTQGLFDVPGMVRLLKPYQAMGVGFMLKREKQEDMPRGGILADEMGLGKTTQALALIANPLKNGKKTLKQKTLVVTRAHIVDQWLDEIEGCCVAAVTCDHISNKHRKIRKYPYTQLLGAAVLVTSYHDVLLSYQNRMVNERNPSIHDINFDRIVLDEAHMIKNWQGAISEACRALKGTYRWALSGTPIQNRLEEFFPLFHFLQIPYTDSLKEFNKHWMTFDSIKSNSERRVLETKLDEILLKRTVNTVFAGQRIINVPEPKISRCSIRRNILEGRVENQVDATFAQALEQILVEDGGFPKKVPAIALYMLMRRRQLSSHFILAKEAIMTTIDRDFLKKFAPSEASEAHDKALHRYLEGLIDGDEEKPCTHTRPKKKPKSDAELRKIRLHCEKCTPTDLLFSPRVTKTVQQVKDWLNENPKSKTIIFTHFAQLAKLLCEAFQREDIFIHTFHGLLRKSEKTDALWQFKNNPKCKVLIATNGAFGEGVNAQIASAVIQYDLWWNLSSATQARARTVRIGQEKEVKIVDMFMEESIDARMRHIQIDKQAEIEEAIDGKSKYSEIRAALTLEDIKQFFNTGPRDKDIVVKQEAIDAVKTLLKKKAAAKKANDESDEDMDETEEGLFVEGN